VQVVVIPMVRSIRPVKDLVADLRLRACIRKRHFDVVHTHSSKAGFLGRRAAAACMVARIVHTPHVFPFEMEVGPFKHWLYVALERHAARFTDRLVCVSEHERDMACEMGLIHPDIVTVIRNGIDVERIGVGTPDVAALKKSLGIDPASPAVGVIGRFTQQKGHEFIVRAFRHVIQRFPRAQLVMVGEGELAARLEDMVYEAALGRNCRIVGPRKDMLELYPAFDVVALPSLWEGTPYTMLEAMAWARGIVATRVGGIPEIIDPGRNGLLVPPRDVSALAAAIVRLLASRDLRAKVGDAARQTVRRDHRLQKMIAAIETVYEGRAAV
jgi:glycosyltransferase involved in cell wall biosynthesis